MTNQDQRSELKWPGVATLLGFFVFLLFIVWTIKGTLPWQ